MTIVPPTIPPNQQVLTSLPYTQPGTQQANLENNDQTARANLPWTVEWQLTNNSSTFTIPHHFATRLLESDATPALNTFRGLNGGAAIALPFPDTDSPSFITPLLGVYDFDLQICVYVNYVTPVGTVQVFVEDATAGAIIAYGPMLTLSGNATQPDSQHCQVGVRTFAQLPPQHKIQFYLVTNLDSDYAGSYFVGLFSGYGTYVRYRYLGIN